MYAKLEFYLSTIGEETLYAIIKGDHQYPSYYHYGRWEFCAESFEQIKRQAKLKKINTYDALLFTFGSTPKDLYRTKGYCFYERKRKEITDYFKYFFDEFISFAKDDYHQCFHNKKHDLTYYASELDEHYGTDYYETILGYYDEYLQRKAEYPDLNITKLDGDFFITFDISILN